jgi:outer membrane protein assembly factor BamA
MSRIPIATTVLALAVSLAGLTTECAQAAARLEVRGTDLPGRHVERLFAAALGAPGDSTGVAASLGALVGELQGEGFLDARADAAWDSAAVPVLRVVVQQGPRYRLAALSIDTPTREDSVRFAAAIDVVPGGWVSPARLGDVVERAVREVADHGHPYATLGVSALSWDSAGARVRLSGALGPIVTVTSVRIEGLRATRPSLAERSMGRLQGSAFSQAAAMAARERLVRLGLFRAVEYRGLEGEGDWQRARLIYRVEEPRYNRFEGALGMQGERRAVGLASLALDNLAGTGRALALRWESRGRGVAEFGAHYAEPLLFGTPLRAEVVLEQQEQDTLFTRSRWGGRLRFTLSEHERVAAGFAQERVVQARGDVQAASLQTTEFALEREGRDVPSAPRRGTFARIGAAQVFKGETLRPTGRRNARSSAIEGLGEWHRPLGARAGLALELSGAARFSSQRVLPLFERYTLGGAASLRGQDEQAFRVDRYALSRLEWRWFLGGSGERVFVFWDHAFMGTRVPLAGGGDRLEQLHRDGIGFGLRLDAAAGTVGVDYGLEPGRAPLDGKIHLRLVTTF